MANAASPSKASTRKAAPRSRGMPSPERAHMIAEAAYYIAEQRGFSGGDPLQDWLDAEAQVDRMSTRKSRAR